MRIIPSILVKTKEEFHDQTNAVDDILPMIQLDIADGNFVDNMTWYDPEVVEKDLMIDCELHLMVDDPMEELKNWENVLQVKRAFVHYESKPEHMLEAISRVHSYGWDVGIVLNPDTPVDVVDTFAEEIDAIMLMGVVPGEQGQTFIPDTLERGKEIKKKYPNLLLSIDGSVNEETLPGIIEAGFDIVCPGSAIFGNDRKPRENVERMKKMIKKLQ